MFRRVESRARCPCHACRKQGPCCRVRGHERARVSSPPGSCRAASLVRFSGNSVGGRTGPHRAARPIVGGCRRLCDWPPGWRGVGDPARSGKRSWCLAGWAFASFSPTSSHSRYRVRGSPLQHRSEPPANRPDRANPPRPSRPQATAAVNWWTFGSARVYSMP